MMKRTSLFFSLIISMSSLSGWAGCADLGSITKWVRIDTHKIIMYRGSTAIAMLDIPYCYIYPTSEIKVVNDYVCNWDKIIVEGEVCDIRNVEGF